MRGSFWACVKHLRKIHSIETRHFYSFRIQCTLIKASVLEKYAYSCATEYDGIRAVKGRPIEKPTTELKYGVGLVTGVPIARKGPVNYPANVTKINKRARGQIFVIFSYRAFFFSSEQSHGQTDKENVCTSYTENI